MNNDRFGDTDNDWITITKEPAMSGESFGKVIEANGQVGVTTRDFMRANPTWVFAEVWIPPRQVFPRDMLRYDCCEVAPGYEHLVDVVDSPATRYIIVRKKRALGRKWTTERWSSFGCPVDVISDCE